MSEAVKLLLGLLLAAVVVTALASAAGWVLAPARRTARALRRRLAARPDAVAVSPEQACGVGVSAARQAVAIMRFAGDPGLLYSLGAVRGVELILDGEVKARAFRGESRRALDRITPGETGRVTLRLSIDDDAEPEFEVDLWRPGDRVRPGHDPVSALVQARATFARFEAAVQKPSPPSGSGGAAVAFPAHDPARQTPLGPLDPT